MSADDLRRRRIASFMLLSNEEMKAAEMLMETLPRQSAFFQQQSAEKLLRAVLEVEGIPAGPTHNLRTLTDLLNVGHEMRQGFLSVEEWSSAATRFRYPGGSGDAAHVSTTALVGRQKQLLSLRSTVESFVTARATTAGQK